MFRSVFLFSLAALTLLVRPTGLRAGQQRVSEDRDLKELDLSKWDKDCLNHLEGTAKTQDGTERNRLKNRSAPDASSLKLEDLQDTAGLLKRVAEFEAQTKGKRRKDLSPPEQQKLAPLEKQIVQLTGYLVLAYCGPPETTNCASVDFHDWHLEVFEKPQDHPPQPGDPTPLICEITPRTQNAIYHDNIRIQQLAGFFRKSDLTYEPTGHPARKIRVTGYLLWDDEHNGAADVGTTIRTVAANKFHNPWRSIAWEIHPVIKIEPLDGATAAAPARAASEPSPSPSSPPQPGENVPATPLQSTSPAAVGPTPEATPAPATPAPTPTPQQVVTITQPVKIRIPYGETILPRGTKLPIATRDGQTVNVQYMGGVYPVPVSSTDLPP